jgi:23S rRNA G2445 N2-methylase RlmL
MVRTRTPPALPACYALLQSGLEDIAAQEIEQELRGEVKRTARGLVVFRVAEIDAGLLALRTVEDVFLLAWGTDQLSYRAEDLDRIRRWTAREPDWPMLLRLHHALRPRPRGRPTYHVVTQMQGHHGYRRQDARDALADGLAGKLPAGWRPAQEGASLEIWLTIDQATAICGVRLSDRTMRHRRWKVEHTPASLRPTVAAAMIRLAEVRPGQMLLDPMCGAGTILAEYLDASRRQYERRAPLGGDIEREALRAAALNLRHLGPTHLVRWDARRLPMPNGVVDRVVSNPPFGKQLAAAADIAPLYRNMLAEYDRVLRAGGRAVLLVTDLTALRAAARAVRWKPLRQTGLRVLGQRAVLTVWHKAPSHATMA